MILDSSYLIDLMNGDPDAHDRGRELVELGEPQVLPSPVAYEIRRGAARVGTDEERRRVDNALEMYATVPLTPEAAERAGRLHASADTRAGGSAGLDQVDPMVAAIADGFDDSVLTDNVADFEKLGVPVETY